MKLHNPLNPTTGLEDPGQLPWSDGVPSTGQEGSFPPSAAVVEPMTELANLLAQAGLVGTSADLFQVTRAVRGGQLDFDATDTGTADAVLCQISLAHTQLAAGLPFTFIKGPAANTGDTVPTLTITDLAGNNGLTGTIVKAGGGALKAGDLPAGALITVRARAAGVFAVVSLLTLSDVITPTPGASTQKAPKLIGANVSGSGTNMGTSANTTLGMTVPANANNLFGTSAWSNVNSTLTVGAGEGGLWFVSAFCWFSTQAAAYQSVNVFVNGNQVELGTGNPGSGNGGVANIAGMLRLNPGDVVKFTGYQQSGQTFNTQGQGASMFLLSAA